MLRFSLKKYDASRGGRGKFQGLEDSTEKSSKAWKICAPVVPMLGILLAMLALNAPATESDRGTDLRSFDALVTKLASLRSEIAAEKRLWREQRPQWGREIELLEVERERLQTELEQYREERSDAVARREDMLRRQTELEQLLKKVEGAVRRAEIGLRAVEPMIPPALRANLDEAYRHLPENDRAAENTPLTRRLQRVLALYSGIQRMQTEMQTARVMVELPDGRREMDVIYLGLARAYAISPDASVAAVGRPGAEGWTWTRADGFETRIRDALAVYSREVPVRLVELPLEIDEVEK